MAQINAYLPAKSRANFEAYAVLLGLDAAELARLLIVREMMIRRLKKILQIQRATERGVRGQQSEKLTAHFHKRKDVAAFDKYAKTLGLKRSAAAKLIFETELREKWLLQAFSWHPA
jgi:hypothetical protein